MSSKKDKHESEKTEPENEEDIDKTEPEDVDVEEILEEETGEEGEKGVSDEEEKEDSEEYEGQEEETEEPTKEQLEEEIEDMERSLKKLMADFDNYRKRTVREKKRIIERATEDLMVDLLDVLHDFDRALDSEEDIDIEGVEMIYNKFYRTLENHGLEEIDAEDDEFDPHYHECVMSEEVDDEELKNQILEQFEKGYRLNSKVIKPAKVKVGK